METSFGAIARALVFGGLLLLLAACASPGGYGGYPDDRGGYGQPDYGDRSQYDSQLSGTVDGLDQRAGRILLVVDDPRSGRTQRVELRYDQRTRLYYQGRELAVEGLERGDVVRVDAVQSGRELWARTIDVVRDVRDGGYGHDDGYGSELRGSVAWVDARAGRIRLDGTGYEAGRGGSVELAYDGRTTVEYQGRRYRPEDLERGDRVRVQARQLRGNEWLAERIIVERSVR
jgi:hypothetical protein